MRKLMTALAFTLATFAFVGNTHGYHVTKGEEIGAFLICETPESALRAMKFLILSPTPEQVAEYRGLIADENFPCIDTRSVGIPFLSMTAIKKVPGYGLSNDGGIFTLWKVWFNGNIRYTYEGDETTSV